MTDKITYLADFLEEVERSRNLQYGVMLRRTFKHDKFAGKTFAMLEDTTHYTKGQALDEAMSHSENDLMGLFEIDMVSGEMKQLMNRFELIEYCEERRRDEMTDGERAEDALNARVDDRIDDLKGRA